MFEWLFSSRPSTDVEQIVQKLEKTRIERELAIREAIVERKNAYKIAEARERFKWTTLAGGATIVSSVAASIYHKNLFYAVGVFPISILMAYDINRAYGKHFEMVLSEMENVYNDSSKRLSTRIASIKEIDSRVVDIISSPELLD